MQLQGEQHQHHFGFHHMRLKKVLLSLLEKGSYQERPQKGNQDKWAFGRHCLFGLNAENDIFDMASNKGKSELQLFVDYRYHHF